MTGAQTPTIGRIVLYRSRTGNYTAPAIVTATHRSLNPKGVDAGAIPPLTGDDHLHLQVLTPGTPGKRIGAGDFVDGSDRPVAENVSGTYTEWDVPFAGAEQTEDYDRDEFPAGTWAWPARG